MLDDESSGFGALSFSGSKGLQNGPNDGIALVNDLGALIQFISYEDFTWNSAQSSFGELNVGQRYNQVAPSVLVQKVDEPGQLGLMCLVLLGLFASRRVSRSLSI